MKVGLPISTTHRRLKQLEKEGVISGYRAIVNYEKIGKPVTLLVYINLSEEKFAPVSKIKENLKNHPEIYEMYDVEGGNWDIVLKARLSGLKDIISFLENIRHMEGVEEVLSSIIIEETYF